MKHLLTGVFKIHLRFKRVLRSINLFAILLLGVSTISANTVFSQQNALTVHLEDMSIKQAIHEIEKNSDYVFVFSDNIGKETEKKVSVKMEGESIEKVLSNMFAGTDLTYQIIDKQVVIYRDETKKSAGKQTANTGKSSQQSRINVSGQVRDELGEPLIGVSISVRGTTEGVVTDLDGRYTLQVEPGSTLVFSYISYVSQEIVVRNQTVINVTMLEDTQAIDEVVVVGYGVQKKANLTGAVTQISGEELSSKPVANVMTALQGELPGVTVIRESGQPGATGSKITIRGASSVNDADALILIDGIPGDMNILNPNDIESISVLKDAAAASIYGSRAAAGVILITTKKGIAGKVQVTYDGYFSVGMPGRMGKRLPAYEEQEMVNISRLNSRGAPEMNAEWSSWVGNPNFNYRPNPNGNGRWDYFATNNWLEESFRNIMPSTQHTVAVAGGSEKFNYRTSIGYRKEEGFFKYGPDDAERYNASISLNSEINKYIDFAVHANYISNYRDENPNRTSIITNAFRSRNRQPVFSPEEDISYEKQPYQGDLQVNPIAMQRQAGKRRVGSDNLIAKGNLNIKNLVDGLTIQLNAIRNQKEYTDDNKKRTVMAYDMLGNMRGNGTANNPNSYEKIKYKEYRNTFQAIANYQKTFDNAHNLQVMAGTEYEDYRYDRTEMNIKNMVNNDFFSFNYADISTLTAKDEIKTSASMSYFGRLNYDYKGKYLLEGNIRYDGSSRLAPGHRWKMFPSFSAGWRISEEEFMKGISWLNNLKVRGSWGELGNAGGIGYYDFLAGIESGKDVVFGNAQEMYYYQKVLASQKMSWEIIRSTNIGFDLSVLSNRLVLTWDYYWKENRDMLISLDTPHSAGIEFPKVNLGRLKSWGWELDVRWRDKIGPVNYWVGFNLSDPQNKLVDYGGVNLIEASTDPDKNKFVEGYPINSMWIYKTDGYWSSREEYLASGVESFNSAVVTAGDVKYLDLNGDKKILNGSTTTDDPQDLYYAGTSDPRFLFGINLGATWNNFDLSIFLQGVGKRKFLLNTETLAPLYRSYMMPLTIHRDYWTPENTDAFWPRLYEGSDYNYKPSDRWIQDGKYMRLKNIQLGYTVPIPKRYIERLRVYVSGDNLCEFTNALKIVDPESPTNTKTEAYPFARTVTFGVNLTF